MNDSCALCGAEGSGICPDCAASWPTIPDRRISFAPNGITTTETCPVCDTFDMEVEHGMAYRGDTPIGQRHFEHCPGCGDSMVIVAYDCPHCKEEREAA